MTLSAPSSSTPPAFLISPAIGHALRLAASDGLDEIGTDSHATALLSVTLGNGSEGVPHVSQYAFSPPRPRPPGLLVALARIGLCKA